MKNQATLYSTQHVALFTYFILLACTTYFVFSSFVAENPLVKENALTVYVPILIVGGAFVILDFIFLGLVLYFALRKTMQVKWIMTIAFMCSIFKPFFDEAMIGKDYMLLLPVSCILFWYIMFPSEKKKQYKTQKDII